MTDHTEDLDLDAYIAEEGTFTVKLGGKRFTVTRPTVKLDRQVVEAAADMEKAETTRESNLAFLDGIAPQAMLLLKDERGKPPTQEFLEEHLTAPAWGQVVKRINEGRKDDEGK